jgi:hypothetical protein
MFKFLLVCILFFQSLALPVVSVETSFQVNDQPLGNVEASLRYYQSLTQLVRQMSSQRAYSLAQLSYYFNLFAKKIDQLPILNVDSELLFYGQTVAGTFRNLSALDYAVTLQNGYLAQVALTGIVNVSEYYNPYWGWPWGSFYRYTIDYNQIAAYGVWQLVYFEKNLRIEVWNNIHNTQQLVRSHLVQRYQVEF